MFIKRFNLACELLIALFGAGASGTGAFAIWQSGSGAYIWAVFSALAVGTASAKPILNLASVIERYAKLYAEYTSCFMSLKILVENVRMQKSLSGKDELMHQRIRSIFVELARDDDPRPSVKLIRKLQGEVCAEIPVESLWIP